MATREEDYVESVFTASTHDFLLFFSSRGQVYVRKGYQIPEAGRSARGTNIVNILPLEPEEKISAMLRGKGLQEDDFIMFFTKNGVTKRMSQLELRNVRKNGIRALDIREGDELVQALTTHGSEKLLVVTRGGMAIRFDENDVRPMGRTAAGVRAIRLKDGDEVVAAVRATDEDAAVLTVTENGYGKRTRIGEYSVQNRGGQGLKTYQITQKTGEIVGAKKVTGEERISCSYRTTARSSAWRPAASRFSAAPRRVCGSCARRRARTSSPWRAPSAKQARKRPPNRARAR